MSWPRRIVPGTTYLLTRRCVQRRYTLVPRGVVPKLLGYCVALAAERARVVLYQPEAKYDPFPAKVTEALGLGKKAFSVRKSMAK